MELDLIFIDEMKIWIVKNGHSLGFPFPDSIGEDCNRDDDDDDDDDPSIDDKLRDRIEFIEAFDAKIIGILEDEESVNESRRDLLDMWCSVELFSKEFEKFKREVSALEEQVRQLDVLDEEGEHLQAMKRKLKNSESRIQAIRYKLVSCERSVRNSERIVKERKEELMDATDSLMTKLLEFCKDEQICITVVDCQPVRKLFSLSMQICQHFPLLWSKFEDGV